MKAEIDPRATRKEKRVMTTVQTEFRPAKASTIVLHIVGVILIAIAVGFLAAVFSPLAS